MAKAPLHFPTVFKTGCATYTIGMVLALVLLPFLFEGLTWLFELIDQD